MHFVFILFYTITSLVIIKSFNISIRLLETIVSNFQFDYTSIIFHKLNNIFFVDLNFLELNATWQDLLALMHIRITKKKLRRNNQAFVALKKDEKYLE